MRKALPESLICFLLIFCSCSKEDLPDAVALKNQNQKEMDYGYHTHIYAPEDSVGYLEDDLQVYVTFESHKGLPVYHIHVLIIDAESPDTLYNAPGDYLPDKLATVYNYVDEVRLSKEEGYRSDRRYRLVARVWGDNDEPGPTVSEEVVFKIEE